MQGLDNLRRVAGLMGEGGPSAGRLGGLVQGQIDQFVNGLSPADIVGATDPAAAAASLNSARSAWQTYSKASDLDNAVAGARAKGDMALIPGSTVDAATRNAVARLRDSRASWSPDELQALNEVAKGSPTQRALRVVGALAPNSPITALMHAGGLIGGLATGGVGTAGSLLLGTMATGLAAKAAANRLTANAVGSLGNLIRSGGVARRLRRLRSFRASRRHCPRRWSTHSLVPTLSRCRSGLGPFSLSEYGAIFARRYGTTTPRFCKTSRAPARSRRGISFATHDRQLKSLTAKPRQDRKAHRKSRAGFPAAPRDPSSLGRNVEQ